MKFKAKVLIEVDIDDYFIQKGYNKADMVEHEIGSALNGSGLEWEVIEVNSIHVEGR